MAVTWDTNTWRMYVDGMLASERTDSGRLEAKGTALVLGANRLGQGRFIGAMDDLLVHKEAKPGWYLRSRARGLARLRLLASTDRVAGKDGTYAVHGYELRWGAAKATKPLTRLVAPGEPSLCATLVSPCIGTVGWWRLDELVDLQGQRWALDEGELGMDGKAAGTVAVGAGFGAGPNLGAGVGAVDGSGSALELGGAGHIEVPHNPGQWLPTWTAQAAMRTKSLANAQLVSKGTMAPAEQHAFKLYVDPNSEVAAQMTADPSKGTVAAFKLVADSGWAPAASFDGDTLRVFAVGKEQAKSKVAGPFKPNRHLLFGAAMGDKGQLLPRFSGSIRDVRISNRALQADELMHLPALRPAALAYLPLEPPYDRCSDANGCTTDSPSGPMTCTHTKVQQAISCQADGNDGYCDQGACKLIPTCTLGVIHQNDALLKQYSAAVGLPNGKIAAVGQATANQAAAIRLDANGKIESFVTLTGLQAVSGVALADDNALWIGGFGGELWRTDLSFKASVTTKLSNTLVDGVASIPGAGARDAIVAGSEAGKLVIERRDTDGLSKWRWQDGKTTGRPHGLAVSDARVVVGLQDNPVRLVAVTTAGKADWTGQISSKDTLESAILALPNGDFVVAAGDGLTQVYGDNGKLGWSTPFAVGALASFTVALHENGHILAHSRSQVAVVTAAGQLVAQRPLKELGSVALIGTATGWLAVGFSTNGGIHGVTAAMDRWGTADCTASGVCSYFAKGCDDGEACTLDTCDAKTGCIHTPIKGCMQEADHDRDRDGVPTETDSCPTQWNPDQDKVRGASSCAEVDAKTLNSWAKSAPIGLHQPSMPVPYSELRRTNEPVEIPLISQDGKGGVQMYVLGAQADLDDVVVTEKDADGKHRRVHQELLGIRPHSDTDLDGVVAYWRLDDDVKDTTGKHDGSNAFALPTVGRFYDKYGALQFDGKTALVIAASTKTLSLAVGTWEVWFKPASCPTDGDEYRVLDKDMIGGNDDLIVFTDNSCQLKVSIQPKGGKVAVVAGGVLKPDSWTHAGVTWDGHNYRLFQDGVEVAMHAATGPVAGGTRPFVIGGDSYGNGDMRFHGAIDEVLIHSVARPASYFRDRTSGAPRLRILASTTANPDALGRFSYPELTLRWGNALAKATDTLVVDLNKITKCSSLVASCLGTVGWWRFDDLTDGLTADVALDSGQFAMHGRLVGNAKQGDGVASAGLELSGGYVEIPHDSVQSLSAFTVEVHALPAGTGPRAMVDKGSAAMRWAYHLGLDAAGKLVAFQEKNEPGSTIVSPTATSATEWNALGYSSPGVAAMTYLHRDGVEVANFNGSQGYKPNVSLLIGGARDGGGKPVGSYNGKLDEVRISNRKLNADEFLHFPGAAHTLIATVVEPPPPANKCDDGNVCTTDSEVDGKCSVVATTSIKCDAAGKTGFCDNKVCKAPGTCPLKSTTFDVKHGRVLDAVLENGLLVMVGSVDGGSGKQDAWIEGRSQTSLAPATVLPSQASGNDWFASVARMSSGGVVAAGAIDDATSGTKLFVARFDKSLGAGWAQQSGASGDKTEALAVNEHPGGRLAVVGFTNHAANGKGDEGLFELRGDLDGKVVWSKQHGTTDGDRATAVTYSGTAADTGMTGCGTRTASKVATGWKKAWFWRLDGADGALLQSTYHDAAKGVQCDDMMRDPRGMLWAVGKRYGEPDGSGAWLAGVDPHTLRVVTERVYDADKTAGFTGVITFGQGLAAIGTAATGGQQVRRVIVVDEQLNQIGGTYITAKELDYSAGLIADSAYDMLWVPNNSDWNGSTTGKPGIQAITPWGGNNCTFTGLCAFAKNACNDLDPCTADTCDKDKGCVHTAIKGCVAAAADDLDHDGLSGADDPCPTTWNPDGATDACTAWDDKAGFTGKKQLQIAQPGMSPGYSAVRRTNEPFEVELIHAMQPQRLGYWPLDGEVSAPTGYGETFSNKGLQATLRPGTHTAVTIAAWVRFATTKASNQELIGFGSAGGAHAYFDYKTGPVGLFPRITVPGCGGDATSLVSVADGQWHHVAYVVSSAGLAVFVDSLKTGSSAKAGCSLTTAAAYIGANSDGAAGLDAAVDDLVVWGEALSEAAVQNLATAKKPFSTLHSVGHQADYDDVRITETDGAAPEHTHFEVIGKRPHSDTDLAGVLAYWKLDSDTADTHGKCNAQPTPSGLATGKPGPFGGENKAYVFGHSDKLGFMDVPGCQTTDVDDFTLEAWFKVEGGSTHATRYLLDASGPGGRAYLRIARVDDKQLRVAHGLQLPAGKSTEAAAVVPLDSGWHHTGLVRAAGKLRVYVDGLPLAANWSSGDTLAGKFKPLSSNSRIGYYKSGTTTSSVTEFAFQGRLADVLIHTVARDANYFANRAIGPPRVRFLVSTQRDPRFAGAFAYHDYQIHWGDKAAKAITPKLVGLDNKTTCSALLGPCLGYVGWWRFDGDLATTALDSSAWANHGTFKGSVTRKTGIAGGGIQLDGKTGYVQVPYAKQLDLTQFTIEAAHNPTNVTTGTQYHCLVARGARPPWNYVLMAGRDATKGSLAQVYTGAPIGDELLQAYTGGFAQGTWTAYAGSKNADLLGLWLDGSTPSSAASKTAASGNTAPLLIGMRTYSGGVPSTDYFVDGMVDEVRIMARALGADELLHYPLTTWVP